jgi:hypothetical protein
MVAQVEYSMAGRSRGQVALCAICIVHVETRSAGFLVEPQNQGLQFVSGSDGFLLFGLKTGASGFPVWSSKSAAPGW